MDLVLTNQYAEILLLVNGLAVILYLAAQKKKTKRAMTFGNYETLKKVAGEDFLKASRIVLILKLLALTSLIVAISSPELQEEVPSSDSDYVLALDTSASMMADDIEPSRLEASKSSALAFVDEAPNSTNIGVIGYSGEIEEYSGLTSNHEEAEAAIRSASIGDEAGTATGDAIQSASSLLIGSNQSRTVILITDGKKNVGSSLDDAVEFAKNHNVTVNPIGIGDSNYTSEEVGEIDDFEGEEAEFPDLNMTRLQRIADSTGGNVTAAVDEESLEESIIETELSKERRDISHYFVIFALVLLILEWALATTKYDVLP